LDISYVGAHGGRLNDQSNINVPTPGIKNTTAISCPTPVTPPTASTTCPSPFGGSNEQVRRPFNTQFPYYAAIFYETAFQESNYNALQFHLTQRITHGLNFGASYIYSHNLDDDTAPMDPHHPQLDYGNSTNDSRNTFSFTATYLLPSHKSPGQLLEGWQLNTSVTMLAGFPFNANDTTNDISGTGQLLDRWTLVGDPKNFKVGGPGSATQSPVPCYGVTGSSFAKATNCTTVATVSNMPALCQSAAAAEPTNPSVPANTTGVNTTGTQALAAFGCYLAGNSVIVPPAQGTFGTMARDALLSKAYHNWDFSATKNWKFRERYGVQFRAEFFNLLNRTLYGAPAGNLAAPANFGESSATPDSANPVFGSGPRKIQFGLKLSF
jgi:hypothetical protein